MVLKGNQWEILRGPDFETDPCVHDTVDGRNPAPLSPCFAKTLSLPNLTLDSEGPWLRRNPAPPFVNANNVENGERGAQPVQWQNGVGRAGLKARDAKYSNDPQKSTKLKGSRFKTFPIWGLPHVEKTYSYGSHDDVSCKGIPKAGEGLKR